MAMHNMLDFMLLLLHPCFADTVVSMLQMRMQDPVIASDGICYERAAIQDWMAVHGLISPVKSEAITAELIPNHSLRSLLQALQQRS